MSRILKSPAKYIQGEGVINELDLYLQGMGKELLVIISKSGLMRIKPILNKCFAGKDYNLKYETFTGECTSAEIERLKTKGKEHGTSAIIGIGGGKIIDTAKAVACGLTIPMVIIPTVASTDSPCSSLSIIYKENGQFDSYLFLNNCPEVVIVDTGIIAKAPARLLIAGMGDALATYFEARACRNSGRNNQVGGLPTRTATELAALCWKYLKEDGVKAKTAVEAGTCTEAVENIVEVNTYLSSVGFESGGLGAAHAIQKGFTHIPELHEIYHGEKVAFCTIAQLILENAPIEELNQVIEFCFKVGLPITFADMGYVNVNLEEIEKAAEVSCVPKSTIHNMPFKVTPLMVYSSLLAADALGKKYKKEKLNEVLLQV